MSVARRIHVDEMPVTVESPGAGEQRMTFRVGDSSSRVSTMELSSGTRLTVSACQFESSFGFTTVQQPSEIEFVVSRGSIVVVRAPDGQDFERGGNTLQLGQTRRPLLLDVRATSETPMECVSISMGQRRLRELLGVPHAGVPALLPHAFRAVTESAAAYSVDSHAMTPRLYRLLDELLHADVKGPARLLWHEAKALELIALMTDELAESADAASPRLSASDVDGLERVRMLLLSDFETPPTLAELARTAGFSEAKLKGAFRAHFGTSVFAYLRAARMEEARRLLVGRRGNVTEVAMRMGYANPGKFAAAFRRHFGISPSEV